MSFIRKKNINGKLYAYKITTYYDKEKKYTRQRSEYLGVVDDQTGEIQKIYKNKENKIYGIINFGQAYIIYEVLRSMNLYQFITNFFGKDADTIMALVSYQIIKGGPASGAQDWFDISIEKFLYKNANMKSQNLSKIYCMLGKNLNNNSFFREYIKQFFPEKKGLLIDSTVLLTSINEDINQWGYTSEGIKKSITCLLLAISVEKTKKVK